MTKINVVLNGVNVTISANCQESVSNVWHDGYNHFKFLVSISANGEKTRFNFFDSFANWQKNKTELAKDDLLNALDCFFSDASCYDGAKDFDDFCSEFGYTEMKQYKQALKSFNGCKRHYNAVLRLFGSDWYEVANALREKI
jgi:hypothetical protein